MAMRSFAGTSLLALMLFVLQAGILAGCSDLASWELKGEVKFIGLREASDSLGAKKGTLDYSIHNSGKSDIVRSCIAFTYSTDRNKYHLTVVDTNPIAAGTLVYGQVEIAYDGVDEVGALSGAVVDSVQFK
jgi:hypothetical protein